MSDEQNENEEARAQSAPVVEDVEVLAAKLGVTAAEFAAARALHGWVKGESLSIDAFERAVNAAREFGVR